MISKDELVREVISKANKGKVVSQESRDKISKAHHEIWSSDNKRKAHSDIMKKVNSSAEVKKRRSEAAKARWARFREQRQNDAQCP